MEPVTIVKNRWRDYQLKRIDEAVKQRDQPVLVFVSLDEDAATVAILHQSGLQKIADIDSGRSGKMYESANKDKEYFGEILSIIKQNMSEDSPLVVVGPGFTREHFIEKGREQNPTLFTSCSTCGTGHAGMNGVHEAIKVGVVDQITKHHRVSMETQLVDKLLGEIQVGMREERLSWDGRY